MPSDPFYVVFEVCVWIIVWLKDPNMAHYKNSNRASHLSFLSVGIFIESMMPCIQKDVQDLQQKYRPTTLKIQQNISLYTWDAFYPCVHQTHLVFFTFLVYHISQCHLKFQLCLKTEYAGVCFWMSKDNYF